MKTLDLRVNQRYRLQSRIGGGGFGDVYLAHDVNTNKEVAIKLEHVSVDPSFLTEEAEIYQHLAGGIGIPTVYWFGWECEYRAMAFELLGPSLQDLFNYCGGRFSLKTVLVLADQLIRRLQHVHSKDVIHRDIKPDNFLMGTGQTGNCVYITDLGLSTEYRPRRSHADAPSDPHLLGTTRFASVNGHLGIEQSRRDDMESLGYVLLYFLNGKLPWQGLKATTEQQRNALVLDKKKSMTMEELCEEQPKEFAAYMTRIKFLGFEETPDYSDLRKTFRNLFGRRGFEHDNVFDWTLKRYKEQQEI